MKQTVLHQKHLQLNAKMTDFQGWQVPQSYSDAVEEHHAVRNAAGLFDISFLGRIEVAGTNALSLLQRVFTRNILKMSERSAHYGLICNEDGGILDDEMLFRFSDEQGRARFLLNTNPLNTEKILAWLKKHAPVDVDINDKTQSLAQISLQGPESAYILEKLLKSSFKKFKPRSVKEISAAGTPLVISRTGYTGEHGYEFFISAESAAITWDAIMNAGTGLGVIPCGIASRDVLRIEMGYPLYGNDIGENRNPVEAGLGRFVDFKKNFIGSERLLKVKSEGTKERLAGFVLMDKSLPRTGGSIFSENREIGVVTSGGVSPLLRKGIGMGYVVTRYSQPGQEIEIEIKDREIGAKIQDFPFYKRK